MRKLENQICDLLSSAKFFVGYTKKINSIYDGNPENARVFTIHSILYFSYALSVFKTLFEKPNKPREQSFSKWRSVKNAEQKIEDNNFQKIRALYEKSNFKDFRNKITDHRSYDNANDVLANFLNPVQKFHIEKAEEIISSLEEHIKQYFTEPEYNFLSFYKNDMDSLMSILEKSYRRN